MNLIIFGATGKTGLQLVEQALQQGHAVTAFVRTPSKLTINHNNLTVAQGDVLDTGSVAAAIAGQEAAIVALGSGSLGKDSVRSDGTRNVIAAMQTAGVDRLVVVSAMGLGDSKSQLTFMAKAFLYSMLRNVMADHDLQEKAVMQSGTNWTIVRPSGLTDGPKTGGYTASNDPSVKSGRISRADVADFCLKIVADGSHARQAISVT